uniref:Uncharacterized protein n=1 Tax=Populus trichocarpa TaxID=3694 RepID=A0A2K1X221_POPTR
MLRENYMSALFSCEKVRSEFRQVQFMHFHAWLTHLKGDNQLTTYGCRCMFLSLMRKEDTSIYLFCML